MNLQDTHVRIFGQVERAVLAASELTANDKIVYSAIASYRNTRSGEAWPGRDTIALATGLHPDSVSRSTARLARAGFLVKFHRGRNRCVYTLPLADQRQADRQATPAPNTPPGARVRKPRRARLPVEANPDAGVRTAAPHSSLGDLDEESTPNPALPDPGLVAVEPASPPRGEFSLETHSEPGIAADQENRVPKEPSAPQEVPGIGPQATQAPELIQPPVLAFPEALSALLCAQLARMLVGIPVDDAQTLVDEMAWNARCHVIRTPGGYLRKLLGDYKAGRFSPEVAAFERRRRENLRANEAARAAAVRMRPGDTIPPPPPKERTPEEIAAGLEALAAMRAGLGRRPH